jgi:hypothetical protein
MIAGIVSLSPRSGAAESGGWPWSRVAAAPDPTVMRDAELALAALVEAARAAPSGGPLEPIYAEMFTQAPRPNELNHADYVRRLERMQPGDPGYPAMVLRAADELVMGREYHEGQVRIIDHIVPEYEAEGKHTAVLRMGEKQPAHAATARERSEQATKLYRVLTTTPGLEAMANFDEVLYLAAVEYGRLGDAPRMRESAERLLRERPGSAHVPRVQLVLADHAFDHGDVAGARRRYDQALTTAKGPVRAYALYRRTRCDLDARGGSAPNFAAAVKGSTATIEATVAAGISDPKYSQPLQLLRHWARRDLVRAFARAEPPRRAWALFRRVGDGPTANEDIAMDMLQQLARAYFEDAAYADSTAVYEQLEELFLNSKRRCAWQAGVVVNALAGADRAAQTREALALAWYWRLLRDDPAQHTSLVRVAACSEATHTALRSLALVLHREARQ